MTNRIFTLPSGKTVVLKAPSLDALTELHGLKVFFNDRVAKDIEAARLDLERHRRDPTLYGIDQLQTSTPQMRVYINEAARLVLSIPLFEKNDVQHPRDTFAKSLDSFNRKAKKLTIEQNPILQLTPLKLPKEGRDFVSRRVFTCGEAKDALTQLAAEHEYHHSNSASGHPLNKHYIL